MELEDEADGLGPVVRRIVEPADVHAVDVDLARVGPVERADEIQQGALPAAGRTGERDELARLDPERDVLERADASVLEALPDVLDDDRRAAHFFTTAIAQRALAGAYPFAVTVAWSTSG